MSKITFTPEQAAAIKYRGGDLLVSAAAGSGKTRVLVERLLDRVSDGSNIDEYLVITYTRAAAAELRAKILDEISERLAQNPSARHLRRQSILCYGAQISTIHGFCTELLRENPHMAGLTPDFRVSDENESAIIKAAVLEKVLDSAYDTIEQSDGFRALVDTMAAGRDDSRLVDIILDAHATLQSNPNPRKWIHAQIDALSLSGDISNTPWGALLLEKTRRTAEFWRGEMLYARDEMAELPNLEKAYGDCFDAVVAGISAFIDALGRGWDEARRFCNVDFPRPKKSISGYDEIKDVRKRCKAALERCAAVFELSSAELIEDMETVKPAVRALLELIIAFDDAFSVEKRRLGIVDFSDLEHLALGLLIDPETGEKTGLAETVSRRYKEIMVDEYQDVNAVQELIFNAVSNEGIFMVGDVKQSIYRFRLADPSIFLAKYRSFCDADSCAGGGARIFLSKNFRSRVGILDAVNYIFKNIMSTEFGEMEYTEREFLLPGRQDDSPEPAVELDIIDMSSGADDEESITKIRAEAVYIAERITELTENGYSYSDIVILLRSMKNKSRQYAAVLAEYGIPADMPSGEVFFETAEISAALAILSVIDNPIQDIPLAAAMTCPVYGFTADELAAIRSGSRDTDFYTAVVNAAKTDEKCAKFLADIADMGLKAPDMSADRFIWHVFSSTGMYGLFGAMQGGAARRANLTLLIEYARRFEASGYKGLFGFLNYIQSLEKKGADMSPDTGGQTENAVRIMSIHKSKGLEFPVVFLADTAKRLNNADAQKPLVIHPELGIGAMCMDRERRIEYPTIARLAVQRKLTAEMMAEELRVLYVGMTRARDKLIITAAFADAVKELQRLSKSVRDGTVAPQVLEETRSMAGWILLPALKRPEAAFLLGGESASMPGADAWDIRLIKASGQKPVKAVMDVPDLPKAKPEDTAKLREWFSYVYPHSAATELPSKLTVTELKGRFFDYEAAEDAENSTVTDDRKFIFERPDFTITSLTGAERGTALHVAMQYIDFKRCGSENEITAELERLSASGFLSSAQAESVNPGKIAVFFNSELGRRILNAERVEREFKFSLLYDAPRFYPQSGHDDKILLQGVIDCFFEDEDGLTIVDFKTDYVTEAAIAEKIKLYTTQLRLYSDALERITGKQVKSRIIYFFAADLAVEV